MSTPSCFHRAEPPKFGKYRDMLFLTFISTPTYRKKNSNFLDLDKEFPGSIWIHDGENKSIFCKPKVYRTYLNI